MLHWSTDNRDVALLRALRCRFGGVPKHALPSKRSLRSIRRSMQKTMGGRWFNREIESRIRQWRELDGHECLSQARQPTSTRIPCSSCCDPSPFPPGGSKQTCHAAHTTRAAMYAVRPTTPTPHLPRVPYQQETRRHTQRNREGSWGGCSGDGVNAFRDASGFGVGTMNISNVSCCCGRQRA
ncbi:hypothetical protein FA13DRAFT_1302151 [Coprinellus micaceus]|uniref:Uncharacterized protein n=1 Tax=Coprinellus micaceus TaxID=71717 RepID=A0A4Y7R5H1_COPMI|nr:hypothetical protein FA13DRAFT_1302151 [Coprinellus micaceus]